MSKAYRFVKKKYSDAPFNGEGARLWGGRWNSKGLSAVYLSESIALAQLEVIVHTREPTLLRAYSLYELDIPEDLIEEFSINDLPESWNTKPPSPETAFLGDQWLEKNSSAALKVPSVIVPNESNFLLNPNHKKFKKILATAQSIPFEIDSRLAVE